MRCRDLCSLVLVSAALAGVEPDLRVQTKTVWNDASRSGDLWTCLQAEEWGRGQKPALKLGPVLGGVVIAGSTLLAVPEPLRQSADLGDRVVMSTDRRVWVMAPDGRPVQRSLPLAVPTWTQALGFAGRVVASVQIQRPEAGPVTLRLAAQSLEEGAGKASRGLPILQYEHPVERGVRLEEHVTVADDGSAVAVDLAADASVVGFGRQVLIANGRGQEMVKNAWNPTAVGRGGSWLVTYSDGGQELVRGQRRERISHVSAGPGMVAGLIDKTFKLILADGSDRPLDPGLAQGTDFNLVTVGGWLVYSTGYGAKVLADGDLLSAGNANEIQPWTLVLWRWSDLASDPAARPAATIEGCLSVAWNQPAALNVWTGNALDLVDLSGREPQRSHLATTPAPVVWATTDGPATVVDLGEGRRAVYGADGAELWMGKVEGISIKRQDLAITWRPGKEKGAQTWQLQRLSADPAKRGETVLDLPPRATEVEVGFRGADWVLGRTEGRWRRLGFDGQLIDQGDRAPPPTIPWEVYPLGRFYRDGSRLIAKALPRQEAMERLCLQDAWRFGPATVLLDDRGQVLAAGKKRGDFTEVGVIPNGDRFAMAAKTPVVINPVDNLAAGVLNSGPRAVAQVPADLPKIEEMPPGPWRLEGGLVFNLPRGKKLRWDVERTGFEPFRLRSPEGAGLFVVTRAALLELDVEAAKTIGVSAP